MEDMMKCLLSDITFFSPHKGYIKSLLKERPQPGVPLLCNPPRLSWEMHGIQTVSIKKS